MIRKELGKIQSLKVGFFPNDGASFGAVLSLRGEGWGTDTSLYIPAQLPGLIEHMRDAKVRNVMDLLNKPIEATFENNTLIKWRILTEVL